MEFKILKDSIKTISFESKILESLFKIDKNTYYNVLEDLEKFLLKEKNILKVNTVMDFWFDILFESEGQLKQDLKILSDKCDSFIKVRIKEKLNTLIENYQHDMVVFPDERKEFLKDINKFKLFLKENDLNS